MAQALLQDGCPTCNATTPVNPEDVVISCGFCGTIYTIGRQKIGDHRFFPPTYDFGSAETKIFKFINERMRFRGMSSYGGLTLRKVLVPYWIVESRADTRYRGYNRTTRSKQEHYTDAKGNRRTRTKHITVYEPVDRSINETRMDPMICRMGTLIFGIDKLNAEVRKKVSEEELQDFNQEDLMDNPEKIEFLSGEIKSHEVKELMETRIQDEHRNRARGNTTELFDCRTYVKVDGLLFLHYPIFQAEYTFGKETYRVLMDAYTGKILEAEIPVTTRFRILALSVAISSVSILIISGIILRNFIDQSGSSGEIMYFFLSLLLFFVGFKANSIAWSITSRSN